MIELNVQAYYDLKLDHRIQSAFFSVFILNVQVRVSFRINIPLK